MTAMRLTGFSLLFCLLIVQSLFSNTIQIPGDYTTIQAGINAAQNGDTVLVAENVYYENINFRGKNIIVASNFLIDGSVSHIWNTIIDGSQSTEVDSGSCVMLLSGEDSTAVLQGFTLTRGTGTSYDFGGGALYREGGGVILSNSSATIKNNVIIENETALVPGVGGGGGGGISSIFGNPRILNNVVMLNTATYASGMVLNWSGGIVRNNLFYLNYGAEQFGTGGVMVWESDPGTAFVENNTIVGNSSLSTAGGLSVMNTSAVIRNNIIWGNRQQTGQQVTGHETSTFEYCSTEEPFSGPGNITEHPGFLPNNFLLDSSSPCIDAGDPDPDHNDREDPLNPGFALFPSQGGLRNDIGAYGGGGAGLFPSVYHESIYLPDEVSFQTVAVGDSSTRSVEILNLCTGNLTVDSVTVNTDAGLTMTEPFVSGSYGPVQADTLEIQWKPLQAGSLADTLKIYHNLSFETNPAIVILSGTAEDPTGLIENQTAKIPTAFESRQNYPNPFNPMTTIEYHLKENARVTLKIYNVKGQVVRTLVDEPQTRGVKSVVWDGRNERGELQGSGIYIYRLKAGEFQQSRKMVLAR